MSDDDLIGERLGLPELGLEPGPWPLAEPGAAEFGYQVIRGMLLRRVTVGGGHSVELLGRGDLLFPWREEPVSFSSSEWHVVERARLAVLDLRPGSLVSRSPTAAASIAAWAIDRSRSLALQSAIMSIVGIEERLWIFLWALAERRGRIVPGGAEVEVNVPQSVLAEMVGARRPTVSMALGALAERGLLAAVESGRWLLKGEPPVLGAV